MTRMIGKRLRLSIKMASIGSILALLPLLGSGCDPGAEPAAEKKTEKTTATPTPVAPKSPAAEPVKTSAATALESAKKAAAQPGLEKYLQSPPAAAPEPKKTAAIPADLQPLAIPSDGDHPGAQVEGAAVARIRILRGGAEVLVDTDGFQPVTWDQQFLREGALPRGYFNLRKIDANRDGDLRDELSTQPGLWKMDPKGNITRF